MLFLLAIISIIFVLFIIERNRLAISSRFKHIPGPKEYPLIGSILSIKINDVRDFVKILDLISIAPISKVTVAGNLGLFVRDPAAVQQILSNKEFLEKPFYFDYFELKYGLFSAKYQIWKPIRKVCNNAMNQSAVLQMSPIFNRHIDQLCDKIHGKIGKGTFNIEEYLVIFGIEQIFETMVGHQCQISHELRLAFQDGSEALISRFLNVFYHPNIIFRFTNLRKKIDHGYEMLAKMFLPVIESRIRIMQEKSHYEKRLLLIDDLLEKHQQDTHLWPIDVLRENFMSIIFAGFETTAITIANAILMLAMHPSIDQKLHAEINEFYKVNDELNHDVIKKMHYLDMVVKEVLRLFPAVPGTGREAMSDTFIESIGLIPKGTIIAIPTFKMHRDPEIWGPNAEKFDPDHFLPSKIGNRHPFSYIPFSAGSRNCIGMHYANDNIRMALVKILSQFRFTTKLKYEDIKFKFAVVLLLDCEHSVEVHPR